MPTDRIEHLSLVSMIPIFDGRNSFSDFQNAAESITRIAQWPDSVSIQVIRSRLRSQARQFVSNNKTFFDGNITLQDFFKKLKQQFVTQTTPSLALRELVAGVRQQPGEDVRAYGETVREIYQRALPIDDSGNKIESSVLNDCAKFCFMAGLQNSIKRHVFSSNPQNLDHAIDNAVTETLNLRLSETPDCIRQ